MKVRMNAFLAAFIIGLSVLLVIGGCSHKNVLVSIPESDIPEYAKEHVTSIEFFGKPVSDIVWPVCEEQGDYQFIACEYKGDHVSTLKIGPEARSDLGRNRSVARHGTDVLLAAVRLTA